ncbi:hypothetical protein V7S76_12930 [Aquirufa sp. ROCK2-A2]
MAIRIINVWVKGDFKALSAFDETYLSTGSKQVNDVLLSHIEISNAVILDEFDPKLERKNPYLEFDSTLPNIKIRLKGLSHDDVAFKEDINGLLINEVEFLQKVHLNDVDNYVVKGTAYFLRKIQVTTPVIVQKKTVNKQELVQIRTRIVESDPQVLVDDTTKLTLNNPRLHSFFQSEKKNFLISLLVLGLLIWLFFSSVFFPIILIVGIIYLVWSFKRFFVGYSNLTTNKKDELSPTIDIYKSRSSIQDRKWSPFSKFILIGLFILIIYALISKQFGLLNFLAIVTFIWVLLNYFSSGFGLLKRIFNLIGGLLLGLLAIMALWYLLGGNNNTLNDDTQKDEFIKNNKILKMGDSLLHVRNWQDYEVNKLAGRYFTFYPQFDKSLSFRDKYESDDISKVYQELVKKDEKTIDAYAHIFDSLNTANKWDRQQLAEAIVTSIQTIPYVLVHDQSCQQAIKESGSSFLIQYHKDGKECLPNIKFGIQGGYEFLHNLKGDCDTRSLLCFELLSRYKYPVAMLISEEYGHCILGIDLPMRGKYVGNAKRKYLVWETTAPGFKPGELSPEISDMDKWHIAITN